MDRADRDRFERLPASAPTLALEVLALDAEIVAATTATDTVGRVMELQRQKLQITTSADDELRTAMVRMEPMTAATHMPFLISPALGLLCGLLAGVLLGEESPGSSPTVAAVAANP